jgi:hypothetical protein
MTAHKIKPAQPLTQLTAEEKAQQKARREAHEREAEKLAALNLKCFAGLDQRDLGAVLALVDLLTYGEHVPCMDAAENWVGAFMFDVLSHVAHFGPANINSNPQRVKDSLDVAVDFLRDGLGLRRKLALVPDSVLDYVNSTEWQHDQACP